MHEPSERNASSAVRKRGETPWRKGEKERKRRERRERRERAESEAKKRAERGLHGEMRNAPEKESTFGVRVKVDGVGGTVPDFQIVYSFPLNCLDRWLLMRRPRRLQNNISFGPCDLLGQAKSH
jgi:hypothetical protein